MQHLTIASTGRFSLLPDLASRLAAARLVVRLSRGRVLLYCAVDDHLHVVVQGTRLAAGRLGGNLHKALARPECAVAPSHVKPVEDRRHLLSLVEYVLRQPAKHGLVGAKATWAGSCFPDLAGARLLSGELAPLSESLPRLRSRELARYAGIRRMPAPVEWDEVRDAGLAGLARAVASASGLPDLGPGNRPDQVRARRTFATMARRSGHSAGAVTAALELSPRTVRRLLLAPADEPLERAVRTWLDLESLLGKRG